ncbi:MAG TPA: HD domain-containing protein, partial [Rubrobacter sp.]|nr:HD domain-containing protein [Rubrobacter sp.]
PLNFRVPMKVLAEEVELLVARVGTHPVWGYAHCLRVHALAERLATAEDLSYDAEILRIAALLHDVGLYKAYAFREAPDHARRSADVAERLLKDADFPPQATRAVLDAIVHHPPGAPPAGSVEGVLLKDAVALDYLGAIGLSRILAMVGTEEETKDIPAALWQAESLRRRVPGLLVFESSKNIARERIIEMDDFLQNLRDATEDLRLL